MSESPTLHLFDAVGIEVEYMIVDRATLDVRPLADELLKTVSGAYDTEVEREPLSWSNELALHVVEVKTTNPEPDLVNLAGPFQAEVREIARRLASMGARVMPTAMHPWMDPHRELRLWPHGQDEIYRTFDRIFDCRGHGWANLQSLHLNLPFAGDDEFAALHAAIRVILPILPALAASSPVADGRLTGLLDTRLEVYRHNADRVPSVAGAVIPEAVFTRDAYEGELLEHIYRDLAPLDPDGLIRQEWVNSRGAIARFDRMSIEIRVIDVQECPGADLAVAGLTAAAVRALARGRWTDLAELQAWNQQALVPILDGAIRDADATVIDDAAYLRLFGMPDTACRLGDLWLHLAESTLEPAERDAWQNWVDVYAGQGSLARRIRQALSASPDRAELFEVYGRLADCLDRGQLFNTSAQALSPKP